MAGARVFAEELLNWTGVRKLKTVHVKDKSSGEFAISLLFF